MTNMYRVSERGGRHYVSTTCPGCEKPANMVLIMWAVQSAHVNLCHDRQGCVVCVPIPNSLGTNHDIYAVTDQKFVSLELTCLCGHRIKVHPDSLIFEGILPDANN